MLDQHKLSLQLSRARAGTAPATATLGGPGAAGRQHKLQAASAAGGASAAAAGTTAGGTVTAAAGGVGGTKLVVRNVAFEATRKARVSLPM
jgi:hypothetical protein